MSNGTYLLDSDSSLTWLPLYKVFGINNSGLVIGESTQDPSLPAVVWSQAGGLVEIDPGVDVAPSAINDAGQVVGSYVLPGQPYPYHAHAFLWSAATGLVDIHNPALGTDSFATGLNNNGQVTGYFEWPAPGGGTFSHAFLWSQATGMVDITPSPTCYQAFGNAVSEQGQVIGDGCNLFAFLWDPVNGLQNLNTLAGYTTNAVLIPVAINKWGQIVSDNQRVLTPLMTMTAAPDMNPAVAGQPVTFTATVGCIAGPPPDGETVTFATSNRVLGTGQLVNGVANVSVTLPHGTFGITAKYLGDMIYAKAHAPTFSLTVN
jgi:probable HAF family extracellular repeat protein